MGLTDPIEFARMHGSGNDFIVIRQEDAPDDLPTFARAVCRRRTSIGADGVIVIGPSNSADFSWRYLNADGSDGDMCGNGAMVGARFAVEYGLAPPTCSFTTAVGIVQATVAGERVTVHMPNAQLIEPGLQFEALPHVGFDYLRIGVPHVVGIVENADAIKDFESIGRAIRHDASLRPAGANVNLVHIVDERTIRMRTYERGVEAETLACGTGAICSAVAAAGRGLVQPPVSIEVSSGMRLVADWHVEGDTAINVQLTGIARLVSEGRILAEALA